MVPLNVIAIYMRAEMIFTQAVRPGFSFRLSFLFFFFRVQSQIAVWPLERMRHLCSVRHGSFTEVVVA